MKKTVYIALSGVGVIALAFGIYAYNVWNTQAPKEYIVETKSKSTGTTTITTVNTETGAVTEGGKTFTATDVAAHNNKESCYTVINDTVYDLTMWVSMHPGGTRGILSLCGIDGTEKFMNKHKGGKKFMDVLDRFKIGTLKS